MVRCDCDCECVYVFIQVYVYLDSFFPPGCIYCAICANTDIGTTTHCVCSIKWERNVRLSTKTTTTTTTATTTTVVATKQRTIYSIFLTYDENEWKHQRLRQSSNPANENIISQRKAKQRRNKQQKCYEGNVNKYSVIARSSHFSFWWVRKSADGVT